MYNAHDYNLLCADAVHFVRRYGTTRASVRSVLMTKINIIARYIAPAVFPDHSPCNTVRVHLYMLYFVFFPVLLLSACPAGKHNANPSSIRNGRSWATRWRCVVAAQQISLVPCLRVTAVRAADGAYRTLFIDDASKVCVHIMHYTCDYYHSECTGKGAGELAKVLKCLPMILTMIGSHQKIYRWRLIEVGGLSKTRLTVLLRTLNRPSSFTHGRNSRNPLFNEYLLKKY